ncbi:MAG TPA: hypothetical protein VFQ20_09395 [Burkholderiaceae bacterium]|nr:hypothetical protein [Burkholderiaceae bacterium]
MKVARCLAACAIVAAHAAAGAAFAQGAASSPTSAGSTAVQGCEAAVRETLALKRGGTVDATFVGTPVRQPGLAGEGDIALRGEGRYKRGGGATQGFGYLCNVDPATGKVGGVVLRESTSSSERSGTAPVRAAPVAEPDVGNVSPESCEASAATALKRQWPQAERVQFSTDSRRLEADGSGNTVLIGQGQALPLPGATATHFGYRCTVEPRSGRVVATRITK